MRLVECVPNFCEGRSQKKIQALRTTVERVSGIHLLDVQWDEDHNRSVFTLVGSAAAVAEAAFQAAATAATLIDMDAHRGAHPRIGATDVVPFVPLGETAVEECVAVAQAVGQRIGEELGIPVFLYGLAALRPERQRLASIRKGQYEGLKERIATDPEAAPDFGPQAMGKAGATAVGARGPLVAFNVYLATEDMEVARRVAVAVRASSGGLPGVQAMAVRLSRPGLVQVSMNVTDLAATPVHVAFEKVREEAARHGVAVAHSELVGLMPGGEAVKAAGRTLALGNLHPGQILELRLLELLNHRSGC